MNSRREFLKKAVGLPLAAGVAEMVSSCVRSRPAQDDAPHWSASAFRKARQSETVILKADGYAAELATRIRDGLQLCDLQVRGQRILLKPNLVEHDPQGQINTHPAVITAAIEALRSLDAAEVAIGEGCGHQRDTEYVLATSGLLGDLRFLKVPFLDLNLDDVSATALKSYYMGARSLYFPRSLGLYDMVFSMPKMKTHHWAGVTLSMKNMFGVVPGKIYGWPKNYLHQHDIGRSILDINSTIPIDFCIVDGVVGMQGNGPIQGEAKPMGVLVMGRDPVAVDATCCRLMGIDPKKIDYLRMAGAFLGNLEVSSIVQRGEAIESTASNFTLPPNFENIRSYLHRNRPTSA